MDRGPAAARAAETTAEPHDANGDARPVSKAPIHPAVEPIASVNRGSDRAQTALQVRLLRLRIAASSDNAPLSPLANQRPEVHQPPEEGPRHKTAFIEDLKDGTAKLSAGTYEFVIPTDRQHLIYLRRPSQDGKGHTSLLGRGEEAGYAGMLTYAPGEGIESWSNESGHFLPPSPKAERTLLPMTVFQSWSSKQAALRAAADTKADSVVSQSERIDTALDARVDDMKAVLALSSKIERRSATTKLLKSIAQALREDDPDITNKAVEAVFLARLANLSPT